ncbi:hypothetical protein HPB51_002094 [Rhipicephalus microplus]|uniref:Uncharacterized protein n=1 Tax=Rhipicephalus microplus TaxID=6941 RepID=A0A9J6E693_RHIMP|nr:hypothetical protein HPB51_002094 [Rhipicephalus microplus]
MRRITSFTVFRIGPPRLLERRRLWHLILRQVSLVVSFHHLGMNKHAARKPLLRLCHLPAQITKPGTIAIVIGKGVPERSPQSGLTYACRIPIMGESYLVMPPCFERANSFAEAAVYLMSLLSLPWDNMSIVLETGVDDDPTPRKQMYTSVPAEKGFVKPLPPTIPADIDGDDVPLMYRCWAAPGNRMSHILKDAVWADITLPPDGLIILSNIRTLSAVNSGVWRFDKPFAGTTINVDNPLISAIQFIASERLFVGWHILRSAIGVATDSMQLGSSGEWPWHGETIHFDGL